MSSCQNWPRSHHKLSLGRLVGAPVRSTVGPRSAVDHPVLLKAITKRPEPRAEEMRRATLDAVDTLERPANKVPLDLLHELVEIHALRRELHVEGIRRPGAPE